MSLDPDGILWKILVYAPPAIFAITVHEIAHGWVAKVCGDSTAANAGRLTLNPIKHIDPLGTIILPFTLFFVGAPPFGWAKPVPVIPEKLRNPRQDMVFVALGGPGVNLVMAAIWAFVMAVLIYYTPYGGGGELLFQMANWGIRINVFLALFNMLPIPPLDGGRVLVALVPPKVARILDRFEPFGLFLLFGLIILEYYTSVKILSAVLYPLAVSAIAFFSELGGY